MDKQDQMNIQWYPGHMTKTRRQIEADLKQVDAVCEIVDARIPVSSRNPDIDSICAGKPRILVLNRMDLADPAATQKWAAYFQEKGMAVIATDCKTRKGIADFTPAARKACAQKLERDAARGMSRPIRVMVVGIPNVGKSTLINQISGRKGAKAENRPGVTRGKQWVTVDRSLQLLDTPGILWPKFEDPEVGLKLAYTGAVKEGVIDLEELACALMELLHRYYPDALSERYKVQAESGTPGYQLLEMAGKNRGFLLSRGEIHTERMAKVLVDEFRSGKLGRFTLEMPEEIG
ncbi:MAG: ribosome biogenesis GTPase YlqF [Candidatus Faecousia sp.]|nr:ribosome biogenesis GTPase YlqF [Clostridiales bacterium]MDY6179558.1 ribosome biogenesis GTPase YlqF [Candidatus Faecousia sp.]